MTQPLFLPNATLQSLIKIGFCEEVPIMLIIYHWLANEHQVEYNVLKSQGGYRSLSTSIFVQKLRIDTWIKKLVSVWVGGRVDGWGLKMKGNISDSKLSAPAYYVYFMKCSFLATFVIHLNLKTKVKEYKRGAEGKLMLCKMKNKFPKGGKKRRVEMLHLQCTANLPFHLAR